MAWADWAQGDETVEKVQRFELRQPGSRLVHRGYMPWDDEGEPEVVTYEGRTFKILSWGSNPEDPHLYREVKVHKV